MARWLFSSLDIAVRSEVASKFIRQAQFVALVCVTCHTCLITCEPQAVAQLIESKSTQSTIENRFYINTVRSTSLSTPGAATLVPASDTIAVSGKIVGVDGRPATGADVWAASLQTIPPVRELVKTDSDGNFQLKLLPGTDWSISAYQGSRSFDFTRDEQFNSDSSDVSLFLNGQLRENCSVQVQVLDCKSGQSISEARVYLDDGRVLISDQSGSVDMSGLTRGVHHAVVLARDYALKEVSLYCDRAIDNNNRVRMEPASNMYGTITTKIGNPVADAWVARRTKMRSSLAGDGTYLLSDSFGRFAGAYFPTSDVDNMRELLDYPHEILRAGAPGYLSKYAEPINNTGGVSEPLEIVLKVNQSRDIFERKNIKTPDGTNILMQSFSAAETEEQPTDRLLRGYRASRDQVIEDNKRRGMPDRFQKNFPDLREGQTFQRRVVGQDGLPIEGVRVTPYKDDFFDGLGIFAGQPKTQYTDKFGVVSLSHFDPGDFVFGCDGFASKVITVHELQQNSDDVVMEPRRMLKAIAVDASGTPIEDFQVSIQRIQPNSSNHTSVVGRLPREPVVLQCSNIRGEFNFSDDLTNQGRFRVTITAKGMMDLVNEIDFSKVTTDAASARVFKMELAKPLMLNVKAADVSSGKTNTVNDLTVALINNSNFVEGKVNPFYNMIRMVSDANQIQNVANHSNIEVSTPFGMLAIQAPGFARQFFEWQSSTDQYDIALVPESIIACTIEPSAGQSASNHSTYTLWVASIYERYVIQEQVGDRFEIPNLSRGWYRVLLTDGVQTQSSSDIFVKSGERIDLRYTFDAEGHLKLEEKKSSGKVLADDIQFAVNGKSRRYKTVDEYLIAIKEHVAMRSPEFASTLTKERLFEAIEDSIDKFENPGGPFAKRPGFANIIEAHPVLKELVNAEEWPEGIMFVYNDQNDQPYIALAVPTPEEQTLEQVLVVGF